MSRYAWLLLFLLGGCTHADADHTVLEQVHAGPLEFSVLGEGELHSTRPTPLLVPGKQWSSRQLNWMLPAPAQGALLVVCRSNDEELPGFCEKLNDRHTAFSARIERDFLSGLLGGCSTPVGALAEIENEEVWFRGNLTSTDGKKQVSIEKNVSVELAASLGSSAAHEILEKGGLEILNGIKNG